MAKFQRLLLAAAVLAFVNGSSFAEEPVHIGLMADMSGTNSTNGQNCRRGYEVARHAFAPDDGVNGRKVTFSYADHKGDAKTGLSEFTQLVTVKRAVAVISNRAQVAMSLNPISQRMGVPLLGVIGHMQFKANPYAFQFWPSPVEETEMLAAKAEALGLRRAAVLSVEDEWNLSVAGEFERALKRHGGSVVWTGTVTVEESDFSPLIQRLKGAAPDLVFVNLNLAQAGLAIKKLREHGVRQQLISNVYGGYPDTVTAAGMAAVEGLIMTEPDINRPLFTAALKKLFPEAEPLAITYGCYSALAMILNVLRTPGISDGSSMFKGLAELTAVPLLDEVLPIDGRQAKYRLKYRTVREGRVVDL